MGAPLPNELAARQRSNGHGLLSLLLKQQLLGVGGQRPESFSSPLRNPLFPPALSAKVSANYGATNPPINGKGLGVIQGEGQHAIGDLWAHAAQPQQRPACLLVRHLTQSLKVNASICDVTRRRKEIRRAKTQSKLTQARFPKRDDRLRRRQQVHILTPRRPA